MAEGTLAVTLGPYIHEHSGVRQRYDWTIVFLTGVLMTLGVAMVYSASVSIEAEPFDWRNWLNSPLRQGLFALVGFIGMLTVAHLDYRVFAWSGPWGGVRVVVPVGIALLLLVLVLIPGIGREALGARRAMELPGLGFGFQPSELGKVALVVWLAAMMSRPRGYGAARTSGPLESEWGVSTGGTVLAGDIRHFTTGFVPTVAVAGLIILLTVIEDFGTAALMGAVLVCLLVAGRARWLHLLMLAVPIAVAGAVFLFGKEYRRTRLLTWFSDAPDPSAEGYQIHQALLAIGSGGWTGLGLGRGIQKYGYIPQDHNDFIFVVICEELGVVGGLAVVLLFLLLLWRGWRVAARASDPFGKLLALGLTLMISLQAAFNIAVVTNSIPTKGISLPFVSAGGSGVVVLGLAAGLLASIGRERATPT